jgi:hypothetical protein
VYWPEVSVVTLPLASVNKTAKSEADKHLKGKGKLVVDPFPRRTVRQLVDVTDMLPV